MKASSQAFKSLTGKWSFTRTITGTPNNGKAHGQAEFSVLDPNNKNTLKYTETGLFTTNVSTKNIAVSKEYWYLYNNKSDSIEIYFTESLQQADLFLELKFTTENKFLATGSHLCNQDYYQAEYTFTTPNTFEIKYSVNGPQKDYSSITIYNYYL